MLAVIIVVYEKFKASKGSKKSKGRYLHYFCSVPMFRHRRQIVQKDGVNRYFTVSSESNNVALIASDHFTVSFHKLQGVQKDCAPFVWPLRRRYLL